jgi:hypothetical protein
MDAIGVAARPGFGRIRIVSAVTGAAIALSLVVGLIIAVPVVRQAAAPAVPHVTVTPAARVHAGTGSITATSGLAAYEGLVQNIAAAETWNDHRALIRYSGKLNAMLDGATLGVVAEEHARLEAALAAAWETGDNTKARSIAQQLDALCGTKTVKAYLAFCN